jgi:hypothetical protein
MSAHLKGTKPRRRLAGGPLVDVAVLKDFEAWSRRGKSYGDAIGVLHAIARLMKIDVVRSKPDAIISGELRFEFYALDPEQCPPKTKLFRLTPFRPKPKPKNKKPCHRIRTPTRHR